MVNPEIIYEYIKIGSAVLLKHLQDLKDFRSFQKYIIEYLKKNPSS